ncbi:hypothetical protein PVL29_007292 [Vitis rotundifolia]|uniref:Uncharacterized protein n=1 Tax=Vitis rotundifolia TaxID=103349 RepID=A0AA39DVZ8_VITRO|nr:hypothetical protein PVL29_007292 [Vitis rotundifolia]
MREGPLMTHESAVDGGRNDGHMRWGVKVNGQRVLENCSRLHMHPPLRHYTSRHASPPQRPFPVSRGRIQTYEEAMISVLAQERLLGAALGSIFTGVIVFEQRKCIYKSIADTQSQLDPQSLNSEPMFGKKSHLEFAHLWNKTVDKTLGPVIAALSSRGW